MSIFMPTHFWSCHHCKYWAWTICSKGWGDKQQPQKSAGNLRTKQPAASANQFLHFPHDLHFDINPRNLGRILPECFCKNSVSNYLIILGHIPDIFYAHVEELHTGQIKISQFRLWDKRFLGGILQDFHTPSFSLSIYSTKLGIGLWIADEFSVNLSCTYSSKQQHYLPQNNWKYKP